MQKGRPIGAALLRSLNKFLFDREACFHIAVTRYIADQCVRANIQVDRARVDITFFGNEQFEIWKLDIAFGEDERVSY